MGITPLFSILNWVLESGLKTEIRLIYSYNKIEDRVFGNRLDALEAKYKNFKVDYFCTEEDFGKRVVKLDVESAFNTLKKNDLIGNVKESVDVYLCGPPSFEGDMLKHLEDLPVKVYHEKWW